MIRTRRWNDPRKADDGLRILICRYRPRGVAEKDETWHLWWNQLAPGKDLHAAFYGKATAAIGIDEFRRRYFEEMAEQTETIDFLAKEVGAGKTITLLCATACTRGSQCHRSMLKQLIEQRMEQLGLAAPKEPATLPADAEGVASSPAAGG